MLKVDLIVPLFTITKISLRLPTGIKKYQYFFPVWLYQKDLKDMGVKVRFLNPFNLKYNKLSNIVGISPRLSYIAANYKHIIKKYGLTRKYKLKFFKLSKNRKLLFSANYNKRI